MASLTLAANQTEIIGSRNAPAGGGFTEVALGQQSRLVIDAVELVLNDMTLARSGPRIVELINGATLRLGALAFASMGASIRYRIGAGCTLVLDANLSEPELLSLTTIEFASAGSGRLRYAPFVNPRWRQAPKVVGCVGADALEHLGGACLEIRDGRLVPAAAPQGLPSGRSPGAA